MLAENDVTTCSLGSNECLAFILGPNHFENVLLATCIETHSAWKCTVVDNIARIVAENGKRTPGRTVVLYDCFGMSRVRLEAIFQSEIEPSLQDYPLVLFSVDRASGIEKMALEYGVQGFFYQDDTVETLLKGLAAVVCGECWISRREMSEFLFGNGFRLRRNQMAGNAYPHDLSQREVEILGLLTTGAGNEHIAEKLFISPHTVKTHLHNIFKKIHAKTRLEAAVWAAETLFLRNHS